MTSVIKVGITNFPKMHYLMILIHSGIININENHIYKLTNDHPLMFMDFVIAV
jgi:hypothetical protein